MTSPRDTLYLLEGHKNGTLLCPSGCGNYRPTLSLGDLIGFLCPTLPGNTSLFELLLWVNDGLRLTFIGLQMC